jgi:hypothetical protein
MGANRRISARQPWTERAVREVGEQKDCERNISRHLRKHGNVDSLVAGEGEMFREYMIVQVGSMYVCVFPQESKIKINRCLVKVN